MYGRSNSQVVANFLRRLFITQPGYRDDVSEVPPVVIKVLKEIYSGCMRGRTGGRAAPESERSEWIR